ncbi:hypothetical protein OK074_2350 [Actinobacteria bacterium OK074]|nr:hypothetical protein OK074_2350 [Actinobacteria bacterium OK074]
MTAEHIPGYEQWYGTVRMAVRTQYERRTTGESRKSIRMTEHLDGAVIPTDFDMPVEPLRRAAHYTGAPGSIAEARAFTQLFLEQLRGEWCAPVDARFDGDLLLVVSELVTNADRHSHGPYILELEGTDTAVTVAVYDSSAALPRRYPRDPGRVGMHGLEIVHAVAAELTAEHVPVGKRVKAVVTLRR